jgi:hypothetical protein
MVINHALRIAGGARGVVEGDGIPLVFRQLPGKIRLTFVEESLVILFAKRFAAGKFGSMISITSGFGPSIRARAALMGGEKLGIGNQHLRFAVGAA